MPYMCYDRIFFLQDQITEIKEILTKINNGYDFSDYKTNLKIEDILRNINYDIFDIINMLKERKKEFGIRNIPLVLINCTFLIGSFLNPVSIILFLVISSLLLEKYYNNIKEFKSLLKLYETYSKELEKTKPSIQAFKEYLENEKKQVGSIYKELCLEISKLDKKIQKKYYQELTTIINDKNFEYNKYISLKKLLNKISQNHLPNRQIKHEDILLIYINLLKDLNSINEQFIMFILESIDKLNDSSKNHFLIILANTCIEILLNNNREQLITDPVLKDEIARILKNKLSIRDLHIDCFDVDSFIIEAIKILKEEKKEISLKRELSK